MDAAQAAHPDHTSPPRSLWPLTIITWQLFWALLAAIAFGLRSHRAMHDERLRAQQAPASSRPAQLLQRRRGAPISMAP